MATYATLADLVTRYGSEAVNALADRDGDGLADTAVVDSVLGDVDAEINSYLAPRYTLPLSLPIPLLLNRIACALALDLLTYQAGIAYDPNRPAHREADLARAQLKDIGNGRAVIGAQPEPSTKTAGNVQMVSGGRAWARSATGDVPDDAGTAV